MRISAAIGNWLDRPPEEALHTAVLADRLGFGELWVGEIDTWDAFALATAIGLATDRIAMTVGPLAVSVRDPAMVAIGAASVAGLTRRRIGVALGTSGAALVHDCHGRSHAGAADALEDGARTVGALLRGERAAVAAKDSPTAGFRLRLAPPDGPFTVAALGDRAVRTAAAHADRVVVNLATPRFAAEMRQRVDSAAASAGRRPPALAVWLPTTVDPTPESYAQLIWSLVPYLSAPGYGDLLAGAGFGKAVALARAGTSARDLLPALPLELAGTVGLAGGLGAVRKRLDAYADAGVDEVVIVPVTGGDPGGERTLTALADVAASV